MVVLGTLLFYFFEQRPPTGVSKAAFSRDFVLAWVHLADSYTRQTGRVLGDGPGSGGWRPGSDGRMDGVYLPAASLATQEEIVSVLSKAGLDPCAAVRTARRGAAVIICDGRDIFQAISDGHMVFKAPSGVGLAHVFMPEENRHANLLYFDHVPLHTALAAARLVDQETGAKRSLLFHQPELVRWHGQGLQVPKAFLAQPRPAKDFAPTDFVRLAVIMP
jgi:hypothetical protein